MFSGNLFSKNITYSYIEHCISASVTMKGFFDKNIKSRSKDDRFEAALSFSPFDAFLSLKALDNFLPHCRVDCGSAFLGGEQELAFTWFYRAVKS